MNLMTAAEAAHTLQVGRVTVLRWAKSGTLPAVDQLPGRTGALLFARSDVEALARRRAEATMCDADRGYLVEQADIRAEAQRYADRADA